MTVNFETFLEIIFAFYFMIGAIKWMYFILNFGK